MDKLMQAHAEGLIQPGDFWFGLPRFPRYLIGSHGEVISLVASPKKLKPIRLGNYIGFQLTDNTGRIRKAYLHRLVAEAVHGPCPDGLECCHNDGRKENNDCLNLRWDTHESNEADRIAHGAVARGERNGFSKLTRAQVEEMRRIRTTGGATYKQIAAMFNVSTMTAYRAVTGQSWSE